MEKKEIESVEVITENTVTEKEKAESGTGKKKQKKEKQKKEKQPVDKKKRKKIRRIVIAVILAVIVLLVVISKVIAANTPVQITTSPVTVGAIDQTINTSGTVQTNESKTYFSDVAIKIGSVNVKAGDAVEAGDVLLTYDSASLEKNTQLAELNLKSGEGSYQNSVQHNNESWADLKEANVNLEVLDQQIEDTEKYITNLENKIAKKKSDLAHFGTLLQISLLDWQDKPDSDEYMNLQKQIQLNNYEQSNNAEVKSWEDELKVYNDMLSKYKEYRSEMKSQKSSSENSKLTSGAKEELEASSESKKIEAEDKIENLQQVQDGIKADFNGVITKASAVEGATTAVGAELFTLESTEDVSVKIMITKYDLDKIAIGQKAVVTVGGKEYEGEVSAINKMAEKNQSGAAVVGTEIKILNPDSDIYLGVEAKVVITTAEEKNALLAPVGVVNSDMEGEFVYTIQDGAVAKRRVTTGISSDTMIQILDGLGEGDQMVTEVTTDIVEGMPATAVPQE